MIRFWKHKYSLLLFIFRLLQLIGAIAVIVYYAHDLNRARKQDKYADSKWVRCTHLLTSHNLQTISSTSPDLIHFSLLHAYNNIDMKQIFATTTASLSLVTALLCAASLLLFEYLSTLPLLLWDAALTILWTAVVGVFASMYANENPEMDSGIARMKEAMYWDVANLILWAVGVGVGAVVAWGVWGVRGGRRMYLGRVRVKDEGQGTGRGSGLQGKSMRSGIAGL